MKRRLGQFHEKYNETKKQFKEQKSYRPSSMTEGELLLKAIQNDELNINPAQPKKNRKKIHLSE